MIAELAAGGAALAAIAGWIYAFRARGESNRSKDLAVAAGKRELEAERRADAAAKLNADLEARHAGEGEELRLCKAELERVRRDLQTERLEKGRLYEKLAKAGAPVGDALVDSALDRLPFDSDDHKD